MEEPSVIDQLQFKSHLIESGIENEQLSNNCKEYIIFLKTCDVVKQRQLQILEKIRRE